jgi:hypothetical protein
MRILKQPMASHTGYPILIGGLRNRKGGIEMSNNKAFKIIQEPLVSLLSRHGVGYQQKNKGNVTWFNFKECPMCRHGDYQCGLSESYGVSGRLVHGVKCWHPNDNPWGLTNPLYEDFLGHIGALSAYEISQIKNFSKGFYLKDDRSVRNFDREYARRLQKRLLENKEAMKYLCDRGLTLGTIERFYLGLSRKYINKKTGKVHQNALVCPIMSRDGNFLKRNHYYTIPTITQNPLDKNSWMKGEVACYYGDAVQSQRKLFVCEGLKDVWRQWQALHESALLDILLISSTHGSAFPKEWKDEGFWKTWDSIYCGHDNDEAGDITARKLAEYARREVFRVSPPKEVGKDWTDFWQKGGTIEIFKSLLERAPVVSQEIKEAPDNVNQAGRFSYNPVDINGAYHGGYLYYPVQILQREMQLREDGTGLEEAVEKRETVIIRSDRSVHTAVRSKAKKGTSHDQKVWRLTDGTLIDKPPQPNMYSSWSWNSITAYLKGKARVRSLKVILDDVYGYLRKSIWLPYKEDYALLVLVVPVTFTQALFDAIPLIIVNGPTGSGKSQLGIIMSHLCANGSVIGQTSAASIARHINESRGFVVLDDLESLGSKKGQESSAFSELAQAIKLSYNKSTAVKVWTDVKTMKTEKLNFYGVKLINNTQGVDNILSSRMLHIQTRKMPPEIQVDFGNHGAADIKKLKALRNELHVWTFENIEVVAGKYRELFPRKTDRSEEITAPLKVFVDLANNADLKAQVLLALKRQRGKSVDYDDPIEVLREALRNIIIQGYDWVTPTHIVNEMKTLYPMLFKQESTTHIPEWQRPDWVGRQMRILDLFDQSREGIRKRVKGSNLRFYPINPMAIKAAQIWAAEQGIVMKEPGSMKPSMFCQACKGCPYIPIGCDLMEKIDHSRGYYR